MTVLVDPRMSAVCEGALIALGVTVKRIPLSTELAPPLAGHPDLLMSVLPEGELLVTKGYYEANRTFFDALSYPLCVTDETLSSVYPGDVLLDALAVGDTLYGRQGAVSEVLRHRYRDFVPVKQGYARCSVAMLTDRAAITSDLGLTAALRRQGVAVLTVSPGHIALPGYDTGLIGGAGGRLDEDTYVFFGDLASHPDGDAIRRFAEEQKINAVSLSNEPMSDYGGMIGLPM